MFVVDTARRSAFVIDKHHLLCARVPTDGTPWGVAMASPKPNVDATGGYLGCIAVIGAQVDFFSVSSSLGLLQVMTHPNCMVTPAPP